MKVSRPRGGPNDPPAPLALDPRSVEFVRHVLGLVPWISFRWYDGRLLVYFSTVLVYKPALLRIRYGLDTGQVDRELRFAPSDELGIGPADEVYVELPRQTRSVTVELWLSDQTVETRTFELEGGHWVP